jgi:hypothetical protein
MNFGPPKLDVREPHVSNGGSARVRAAFARRGVYLRGSHWLVVSAGCWRLELADGLTVRDTSSVKRLDMAVARLKGEKIDGLAIDPRSGLTTFYFDLGGRIIARARSGQSLDEEVWSLNNKSRSVSVYPSGTYSVDPVNSTPARKQLPIQPNYGESLTVASTAKVRNAILGMHHVAAV